MRQIARDAQDENPDAKRAFDIYIYAIKKYIGSYVAIL